MDVSPPILVRIEWADSQGSVTASWLAAHFKFRENPPPIDFACDLLQVRAEIVTRY
jgi:hypothetical protein